MKKIKHNNSIEFNYLFTCLLKSLGANYKESTSKQIDKTNSYTKKDKEGNVYYLDQRFSTGGTRVLGGGVI
jgi:hypothetical protein